ncbi:MAG TPA: hypothetical protein DIW17_06740 [Clostridiales bacterium]|nr:hypothetical protein [Clostridiales bacterium]
MSEDNHKIIWEKVIPICTMILMLFLRSLKFYEIKGLVEMNGWAAPEHFPLPFLLALCMFFAGTLIKFRYHVITPLLQICTLIVMLYFEQKFRDFAEFNLRRTAYGFWINIIMSIVLVLYCLFIDFSKHSKHPNSAEVENNNSREF